jgi:tetraacyldisaccharide 4'-kinase
MKTPAFWFRPIGWQAFLLAPASWIYGWVTARRMRKPGMRLPVPVIAIGNLTAGGAGKTPTAMAIARFLINNGRKPVFISRGYGGILTGPILVDPKTHRASDVGDEPLCLAAIAPTIIARNRAEGAVLAQRNGDIIILDDALQNPDLFKAVTIAVIDGKAGFGNGLVVPAGPLRAPLDKQWPSVDGIVRIGPGDVPLPSDKPIFYATLVPDQTIIDQLKGKRLFAFAGIGRPSKFFEMLAAQGLDAAETEAFADHHPFSASDVARILENAERNGTLPVTTEKDAARLVGTAHGQRLLKAITIIPVILDAPGLMEWLDQWLASGLERFHITSAEM